MLAKLVAPLPREKMTYGSQITIITSAVCSVILFLYKVVRGIMWVIGRRLKNKTRSNAQQSAQQGVPLREPPAALGGQSTEERLKSAAVSLAAAAANLNSATEGFQVVKNGLVEAINRQALESAAN
jgi:hypothetical protein